MKHKETITDKIVKNINQALEMIPRALHLEGEKQMRKSKMSRRTAGKKRAGRSSARKSVAQGVKRAKRQTVKSRSKTGSRTRVSASST